MGEKRMNNPKESSTDRREEDDIETIAKRSTKDRKFGYEIRLKNHLDQQWADWFDGWTMTNIGDDVVILTCSATDHAGLHGALDKIRDLNLALISVKRVSVESRGRPQENERQNHKRKK